LTVAVVFAVLAGLTAMGTAAWIAGDYGSGFWTAVAFVSLAALAVGTVVAGCARLLGPPGLGWPRWSSSCSTLSHPVGRSAASCSGLLSSPGAMDAGRTALQLLRGALYFDGAGLASPLLVLTGWLAGGLVLMWLGELVSTRRRPRGAVLAPAL